MIAEDMARKEDGQIHESMHPYYFDKECKREEERVATRKFLT